MGFELRAVTAGRILLLGLELGGNDPACVRPDAHFKHVAAQLVSGVALIRGKRCRAVERFYVYEHVHDVFAEESRSGMAA